MSRSAAVGLASAVFAEVSSVALIGLSGWFVTACAVAGAAAFSAFSYVAPSGGVRAFALSRIGGNYGSRVMLHADALRRVANSRTEFFATVAGSAPGPIAAAWSGELLDRGVADVDADGMQLIRSSTPFAVSAALTAGGIVALGLAVSPWAAAVLAAGVGLLALLASRSGDSAAAEADEARARARAEVVTAIVAWAELVSIGAAGRLAGRTTARLRRMDAARAVAGRRRSGRGILLRLTGLATLAATLACALGRGVDAATLVFAALIGTGVLVQAEGLPAAVEARRAASAARQRLRTIAGPARGPEDVQPDTPALRAWLTAGELGFAGYELPALPLRAARHAGARVRRGGIMVITGRSGSGKSTLLRAIAATLRASPPEGGSRPVVTAVAADDYVFTGTLGSNFRLADPELPDAEVQRRLAEFWLDRSGLTAGTPIGDGGRELSGGERRRTCVARALATRPHVLVVDEPTTGLDERTARHVLHRLMLLQDTTVILAMHAAPLMLSGSEQVTVLNLD